LKGIYGEVARDLGILESDVSLRHLLAIFSPGNDMDKAGDIHTTLQYVISQLNEPLEFDGKLLFSDNTPSITKK
jgi:hypothetical protein